MQYHCVQCNQVFTPEASEDKPRCPTCLRQHGLRVVEAAASPARGRRLAPFIALAAVAAAAVGGYVGYRQLHSHKPGQVPLAPIDADVLSEDAQAITGKNPGTLAQLMAADARVESFAKRVTSGHSTPAEQAKAVVAALVERGQKQAFVPWPRVEAREEAPMTAAVALAAIERDGARVKLYPLELAAIAAAALRSAGLPAMIAEVYRYPNEHTPLDASGRLGYHALVLPKQGEAAEQVFDVYGARKTSPAAGDYRVLNDAQALGAAFALRAASQLDHGGDTSAGLTDAELAVKLSPSSPSVRSTRAALLLATGGVEAGTHEMDAALQLRSDAPRRNNLATLGLLTGNSDAAAKEVAAALAEAPDFALARVTLATIHLMRGEHELARVELEKAERLAPDLALLPQIWAQYYMTTNDVDRALAKAQEAVRMRPKDTQARLVLARIDRAAGRYDDMRAQAREIMARVPKDQELRTRELLRSMLGPSVFEVDTAEEGSSASSSGSALSLSGAAPAGSDHGPRLLDPHPDPSGRSPSLQLKPDGQRLQLGGDDTRLKLKLTP